MFKRTKAIVCMVTIFAMLAALCTVSFAAVPGIVSVTPADGSAKVSVLADVEIVFEEEPADDISAAISVTPSVDYTVETEGAAATLVFADALEYNTAYTITVGENAYTFTTERNPITTLFWEDFSDKPSAEKRFTDYQTSPNYDSYFSIAWNSNKGKNELRVYGGTQWNETQSLPVINEGGNWIDYEVEYDYRIADWSVIGGTREWNANTSHATHIRVAKDKNFYNFHSTKDKMNLSATMASNGKVPFAQGDASVIKEMLASEAVTTISAETASSTDKYYHMKMSLIGTAFEAEVKDGDTSIGKISATIKDAHASSRGSVGFTTQNSLYMYYDNILVTDKGFLFEPEKTKNITNEIKLIFNDTIRNFAENMITVTEADTGNTLPVSASASGNTVTISSAFFGKSKLYNVTVSNTIANSNGQAMSNDKTFTVKASDEIAEAAKILSLKETSIADGSTDISVISDLELTFDAEVEPETVTKENIIVDGEIGYTLDVEGACVKVIFDEALPYESEIKVTLGAGLEPVGGGIFTGREISFETELNPITNLFREDFDDMEAAAEKFVEFQTEPTNESRYSIENNELAVYGGNAWAESHSKPIIKGGESWIDYEVEYDYRFADYNVLLNSITGLNLGPWQHNTNHELLLRAKPEQNFYGILFTGSNPDGSSIGEMFLTGVCASNGEYPYSNTDTTTNAAMLNGGMQSVKVETVPSRTDYYHMTVSLIGTDYKAKIQKGESLLGEVSATAASEYADNRGSVGFSADSRLMMYYDNIVVTDKGFLFEPDNRKDSNGNIILKFNGDIANTTDLDRLATVSLNGEPVSSSVVKTASDTLMVKILEPQDGAVYDVTVSKDVTRASDAQAMSNDKTFDVSIKLDYALDDLKINGSITSNGSITASVHVTNNTDADESRSYTLLTAVYDATGALYDVKIDRATLSGEEEDTLATEAITLPENAEGYRAEAFVWDDMAHMSPLTESISIPN